MFDGRTGKKISLWGKFRHILDWRWNSIYTLWDSKTANYICWRLRILDCKRKR